MPDNLIVNFEFVNSAGASLQSITIPLGQTVAISPFPEGTTQIRVTALPSGNGKPSKDAQDLPGFRKLVLDWLHSEGYSEAVEVTRVRGYGTDWAGDTEGGFYSETNIEVYYLTDLGRSGVVQATGDEFLSLWSYVVSNGHWKADARDV